ncbi:MAG: hypothetical protein ACFCUJ_08160 [Thiotrichales bacterium]
MSSAEFLSWVRGPMFDIALVIFVIGILVRLLEIYLLGRKPDLAAARRDGIADGFKTVGRRFLFNLDMIKRNPVTVLAGYVFHIGLLVAIFLLAPHIEVFRALFGFGWPALPTPIVDFLTALAIIALLVLLWHRLTDPVKRLLSTGEDYLVWALTLIPLLTGYLAYHHLFFNYTAMLGLHILSVELLLIVFPFTKLSHAFTLFISRWYTGMMAGRKGVEI